MVPSMPAITLNGAFPPAMRATIGADYSDNTTVNLQPNQNVTYVSVAWQYRFH